ncbi:gfo/Idh/MocA family oxidoreductase (plasmid) [Rathayibacter sp. VKM Ac-2803]|uniref:Gfo/Idh/MocA family protein n=1 Tax=Rathayibacter TaxID=33886 RepID=UPI00135B099D|nr:MULTISPECIES: Gfo/Idh/MocA family oxidoreductase [Rathayibacter]MWV51556.1 gfo/Idh/MocA family oxidoreductase [Rathayibacter sp. VKM Ac-2803]
MKAQRWAVVGTGRISQSVVPDLASVDGVEIVLLHGRDAERTERFADEHGIPSWTTDYDAVLADASVDALYLSTPFATHAGMTRRALIAGKHVLVEKPMALNAREADELFALASENGVFLMEGMWMKFNPAFRRLHEEIAAGLIGIPRSVRAGFSVPFPKDGGSRWDVARSGSTLLDQGIYPVTLAHTVLGEPTTIHATGSVRTDGLDTEAHFTLEFDGGAFAHGACGMLGFADLSASISGTAGWMTLPAPFWSTTALELHAGTAEAIFVTPTLLALDKEGNGYVPMLRAVAQAIDDGLIEHPVHSASDTVAVFRTLDSLKKLLVAAGQDQETS